MYAEIYPIENLTIRTQFGVDFTHSTAFLLACRSTLSVIWRETWERLEECCRMGTAARQSSDAINLTEDVYKRQGYGCVGLRI